MKEVSLYIPSYNAAKTISCCLDAVLKQSYPIKEVVVVDDGSNDGTIDVVLRYPVRLIRHVSNRGLAATRNTAIKNINTEFVASLDADCAPEPNWLEYLMKRFNSSNIAGVGGRLLESNASSVFDLWRSVHMKQYWEDERTLPPFLFGSNTVFLRKTLINSGLYNEDYKTNYEDVNISNRLKQCGYSLAYESKAIVNHLKRDDLWSILNNFWKWNLDYHLEKDYFAGPGFFVLKLKEDIGLANRYIEEDIACERYQFLYLDFLLSLHLPLMDFRYFISQDKNNLNVYDETTANFWFALSDLIFFYNFNSQDKNLATFIPHKNSFLQNFLVLNFLIGRPVWKKFNSDGFKKLLFHHVFLSTYKTFNLNFLQKFLECFESNENWEGFFKKAHPNLNSIFLENVFLNFRSWLDILTSRFPNIIQMIEIAAEKTEIDYLILKEEEGRHVER